MTLVGLEPRTSWSTGRFVVPQWLAASDTLGVSEMDTKQIEKASLDYFTAADGDSGVAGDVPVLK